MKIAVMGTGAMGGYIGGQLARAGRDVAFIDTGRHLQALRKKGLHIQSPAGDFLIHPLKVTDDPAEIGPVDLILFCVRSYDVAAAQFPAVLEEMKAVAAGLAELEAQLEAEGAPWTPSRIPDWP